MHKPVLKQQWDVNTWDTLNLSSVTLLSSGELPKKTTLSPWRPSCIIQNLQLVFKNYFLVPYLLCETFKGQSLNPSLSKGCSSHYQKSNITTLAFYHNLLQTSLERIQPRLHGFLSCPVQSYPMGVAWFRLGWQFHTKSAPLIHETNMVQVTVPITGTANNKKCAKLK